MAKTILYLEDDDDHLRLFGNILRSEGYDVEEARDPSVARKTVRKSKTQGAPEICGVLADLEMRDPGAKDPTYIGPEVGIRFLEWLRRKKECADVPIVILSIK